MNRLGFDSGKETLIRQKPLQMIMSMQTMNWSITVTGLLKPFFQTPEEGARTAIFLAVDDSVKDISGEYFYKCRVAKSSKRSKDMELAGKLYKFSEELVLKDR